MTETAIKPTTTEETLSFNVGFSESHDFSVDTATRTIKGVVIPWGKTAYKAGFNWSFPRGSVRWSEDVSRVKLSRNHDPRDVVGYALRIWEGAKGLMGEFKVRRGPIGDDVLLAAEDKALDGLSAEMVFSSSADWTTDYETATRIARDARMQGVTLTSIPAFDDARVSGVKMSQEGKQMGEEKTSTLEVEAPETIDLVSQVNTAFERIIERQSEEQGKQIKGLTDAINEAFTSVAEKIVPAQSPRQASFQITSEPPIYRFSGPPGGYSMVKDAWHAVHSRDRDAEGRLLAFSRQVQDMVRKATHEFQQGTGDLGQVIPPGYRPDLYVAELVQGRPLASGLSRGTISDATPFTVPVFSSATGATADHTEGTNPTPGTIALTQRTVQPAAISGSLQLTREIVDSSNPAIDVIAMQAMRESYARQTEEKIYAFLNGPDGAGGTITNGFVPSGAQVIAPDPATTFLPEELLDAHREQLARYSFRRFAAPTQTHLSQRATVDFATAKDGQGRPLLPSVGAQNTSGVGNAVTQGWNVDGLPAIPAWAVTSGADNAEVLSLNSADAWYWESPLLTFRFEEKLGPANIELALFGYFGVHVLRPVGLAAIRKEST